MKTPHNRLTRFPRNLLLVVGIFAALVALFVYYVWSEKQLDRANDQRYNSMLLADELRQSSDDLTRMVRLYVETGEARYGQYYQDILDIRDGRKARPEKYHSIYWDLVLVEGRPPRPSSGQVIPLLELMRQAGFTGPEMQRLAEAKANSDALTAIELAAMKLVGPDDRHAGANHGKARMLVFGDSYHQAKAAIMKPIGEFYALLDQRTLDAVRSAEENAVIWRDVFIAFCLVSIYLLWRFKALQSILAGRISDAAIASSINAIAIAGLDGKITLVNRAFVDLWRLHGPEEAIGRSIVEFWDKPEDAVAVMKDLQQRGSWQGELIARRHDGSLANLQLSASMVKDDADQPFYMMASFVDVTQSKQTEAELQHNRDLLNEAQRLGQLGSWELNLASGELRWTDEVYRIFELDPAQFSPSYENFLNVIHPDDRDKVNRAYTQSLENHQPYDIEHRLLLADGRIKWVREHCSSEFDAAGKPLRSVGAVQDVTGQHLAMDQLRVAAATFQTHEAILITDADSNIVRVNQAFQDITGYTPEEVLGKNPRILSSGREDKSFYVAMWQQLLATGSWTGEIWDRRKDGKIYPKWMTISAVRDEQGATTEYVAIFSDISARKQAETEIRNLAFYDALTRLPNRRLLLDRFHLALSVSARSHYYGAVLFLDMDKFKVLNDTMGHDYGDVMLIEVAQRIQSCVREVDTVARLGGDEFVVLIEEIDTNAQEASQKVALVAEKVRASLAAPYLLKGHEYHSSPSIGVCLYKGNRESVDTVLKHADLAMYQVKDSGRNGVRFFDPAMQHAVEVHAALETDLRRALPNRELSLYYQMQVDNELRPLGAEALLRWTHPQRGMVSPAQFIPVAEDSALICEIGHWVLEAACRQLAVWDRIESMRNLELAINVSAYQFHKPDFVETVAAVIREYQFAPARLKLELTESVVLNDVADVVTRMHALKALGVKLSLDDFGTGYSSLSYLKQLPLDQLKIDQSFVRDIATDPNDAVMVQTIINLAQNFRLNVIAEGVETEAQLDFLKRNGCMAYQGYLFGKPVLPGEFEALLAR